MRASEAPCSSKNWSTNASRLHTVDGSRPHRQHINRWRVWRAFNGQGGGRVGGRTNGVQHAYLQRRAAPFHPCLTHGLPGLQRTNLAGERVSPQRLAACTSDQKRELQRTWRQFPLLVRHRQYERHGVSEFLRGAFATFFGKAKGPTHCECNASLKGSLTRPPWDSKCLMSCYLHHYISLLLSV